MSLEAALEANTAALTAHTAKMEKLIALMGNGAAPAAAAEPAAEKKGPGRPKKEEASAPKVSFDEVKAALMKVKEDKGKEAAQSIIKDVGKVDKMADIKEPNYAAVVAACEAAMAGGGDSGSDDDI